MFKCLVAIYEFLVSEDGKGRLIDNPEQNGEIKNAFISRNSKAFRIFI
jgi:hypothetical protein